MDAPLIWTVPEIVAFTRHADDPVRAWAWTRLVDLHPEEAGRHAARGLADPSWSVAGRALDAFAKHPSSEARGAVEALRRRRGLPPGIRNLAENLLRGEPLPQPISDPFDDEIDRLAAHPDELRRRASELLASASYDDRTTALFALDRQPYRWATDVVLEQLDALLASGSYRQAWETLAELGDPRALRATLAEWRPGEWRIASAARILHRLAGSQDALPEELVRDAEAHALAVAQLKDRLLRGLDPRGGDAEPLRLDLRCTRCGRTYEYDVKQAAIHPRRERFREEGWDGVVLGRIVVCKRCGAEDAYELTTGGMALLATSMPEPSRGDDDPSRPVIVAEMRLWDGSVSKRPSESLRHLRALAERDPGRGEGWRRLGNLCERYDRTDEAVAAWKRAAEDETEMEACYSLAKHYGDRGVGQEAVVFSKKTIERLRGGKDGQSAELRGLAADVGLGIVRAVLPLTREPIALMVVWAQPGPGREAVVNVSSIDLRTVRRWERLVDLFASDAFISAGLTQELPAERTILADLLDSDGPVVAPLGLLGKAAPRARSGPKTGRNDPCSCGSGKKFKKCHGA